MTAGLRWDEDQLAQHRAKRAREVALVDGRVVPPDPSQAAEQCALFRRELRQFTLVLPWPPTGNHMIVHTTTGQHFPTEEYKKFQRLVQEIVDAQRPGQLFGRLDCKIVAYPADERPRDLDNIVKPICDTLQRCGCYEDDKRIDHFDVLRVSGTKKGIVSVTVREI